LKLPDFLIIGGMRCGSTTLHALLRRQPAICLPGIKEVHFFDRRNPEIGDSVAGYQQLFSHCPASSLAGEATPDYLTTEGCDDRIHATIPNVKLITILRDPVQRTWSHYQFSVLHKVEKLGLVEALQAEPERLKIKSDHTDIFFSYLQRSRYIEHLERFEKRFGREQMKVILLDDLVRDPVAVLSDIYQFLGIEAQPEFDELPHLNEMAGLQKDRQSAADKSAVGRLLSRIRDADGGKKKQLARSDVDYLEQYFRDYNQRLEQWLGRPLPWR
jgi:hypothetical protein